MNDQTTFISRIHAYLRGTLTTRRGAIGRAEDAPAGTHKEYPRMQRIALPAPVALPLSLHDALRERVSCSTSGTERSLSARELGTLLGDALGARDDVRRHYPSGGALYPIETYLVGSVVTGYPSGVFHYHPKAHALEFLWETSASFSLSHVLRADNVPIPPLLIVFTGMWNRSSIKYGDFTYPLGLLEAGHMAQNILLTATALSIGSRPFAGYDDATVATLLDLDTRLEQPVYCLALYPSSPQAHTSADTIFA